MTERKKSTFQPSRDEIKMSIPEYFPPNKKEIKIIYNQTRQTSG